LNNLNNLFIFNHCEQTIITVAKTKWIMVGAHRFPDRQAVQ
jgi:hypothetical protein